MTDIRNNSLYLDVFNKAFTKLLSIGMNKDDAFTIADCFAIADSFNVPSHGSKLLSTYEKMIKNGRFNLKPNYRVTKETASFARIDGDNAVGILSAKHCLDFAINKAKNCGVFSVFSYNNNTLGPAFYYGLLAAEQGMICFVCTNSPAQMAVPFGGTKRMVGTNPFAICFPVKNDYPVIIDMATSVVAKSKINNYKEHNTPLPEGWALDSDGHPTTDPQKALEGFILPMAGIKGYSMAIAIDLFAGLLSGSSFLDEVGNFYSDNNSNMNVGFSFVVVDPYIVYGAGYDRIINSYIEKIRSGQNDGNSLIVPGDDRIAFHKKFNI